VLYDHQLKFVNALLKQLPPEQVLPSAGKAVPILLPSYLRSPPVRQGPFLFQPAPHELDQSPGGDATDIVYTTFDDNPRGDSERFGVIMVAFQDGKVDVCLDLDKIEAKWGASKMVRLVNSHALSYVDIRFQEDLPVLTVTETIDLGCVSKLIQSQVANVADILAQNHPVFHRDPIYADTVYVYHAFGMHCILLRSWARALAHAISTSSDNSTSAELEAVLAADQGADTIYMVDTFSPFEK
jgi:nucleoporin NUP82